MGEEKAKDLGISVAEEVKADEVFGKLNRQLKGVGGTLHITKQEDIAEVGKLAWQLSEQTDLPVVVVVRSPRKV